MPIPGDRAPGMRCDRAGPAGGGCECETRLRDSRRWSAGSPEAPRRAVDILLLVVVARRANPVPRAASRAVARVAPARQPPGARRVPPRRTAREERHRHRLSEPDTLSACSATTRHGPHRRGPPERFRRSRRRAVGGRRRRRSFRGSTPRSRQPEAAGAGVFYTQDWHPESTPHFAKDGGIWPVHCVAGTWGAELHPDLIVDGPIVRKGANGEDGYSGFTMRDPTTGETKPTELEGLVRNATSRGSSCAASPPTTASTPRPSTPSGSGSRPPCWPTSACRSTSVPATTCGPSNRCSRPASTSSGPRPDARAAPPRRRDLRAVPGALRAPPAGPRPRRDRPERGLRARRTAALPAPRGRRHARRLRHRPRHRVVPQRPLPGLQVVVGMPPELLEPVPDRRGRRRGARDRAVADGRVRGRRRHRRARPAGPTTRPSTRS